MIDKTGINMLFSGIDHYTDDTTRGLDIAANKTSVSLILKRTGEVLLIASGNFVDRLIRILMFPKYNGSITFHRGKLPD
jgi:hypothetical protein